MSPFRTTLIYESERITSNKSFLQFVVFYLSFISVKLVSKNYHSFFDSPTRGDVSDCQWTWNVMCDYTCTACVCAGQNTVTMRSDLAGKIGCLVSEGLFSYLVSDQYKITVSYFDTSLVMHLVCKKAHKIAYCELLPFLKCVIISVYHCI